MEVKFLKKIKNHLFKTSLTKKFLLGYICILIIPTMILGIIVNNRFKKEMEINYMHQKQQMIDKAYTNLKVDLTKIEETYNLIQYSTNTEEYLSGAYENNSESVYVFIKYIRPVINYLMIGTGTIEQMKIYKYNNKLLSLGEIIIDMDKLSNEKRFNNQLYPGKGMWEYTYKEKNNFPELKYYQKIYDNEYNTELGIMEVTVNENIWDSFFRSINTISKNKSKVLLYDDASNLIYYTNDMNFNRSEEKIIKYFQNNDSEDKYFFTDEENMLINTLSIDVLGIKAIILEDSDNTFLQNEMESNIIIIYVLGAFLIMSLMYYFIAQNVTKRISSLSKHMRYTDEKKLSIYKGRKGNDEIGLLINSYNLMINRINDLIYKVHRAEILKRESDYAALQAQIRPHFLYGTLESIRMLADSSGDTEVSNIIFTFGKLMRYSLTGNESEVTLFDELLNVENYLRIQKLRMGDRLQYDISVEGETDKFVCPRFILQPIVENSIMHGISKSRYNGYVNIKISKIDKGYRIDIIDNGSGMKKEKVENINSMLKGINCVNEIRTENNGFGLYNVAARVKMFFGKGSIIELKRIKDKTICQLILLKRGNSYEDNDC